MGSHTMTTTTTTQLLLTLVSQLHAAKRVQNATTYSQHDTNQSQLNPIPTPIQARSIQSQDLK
uniref:Uncharacterized protein n=1 Tax=Arundo donax TaxID=35708 RepID=A0A0A9BRG8_ARUDO